MSSTNHTNSFLGSSTEANECTSSAEPDKSQSSFNEETIVIDSPELTSGNSSKPSEEGCTEQEQSKKSQKVYNRKENYVYQLLLDSPGGSFLIKQYDLECDPQFRKSLEVSNIKEYFSPRRLAFFVIHHEFETNHTLPTPEKLDWLATESNLLFPTYYKELFYTRSTTGKCATGSFHNLVSSIKERLKLSDPKTATKRKCSEDAVENKLSTLQEEPEEIDDAFLKKWLSVPIKDKLHFYAKSSFNEIFCSCPSLKKDLGYRLLLADFHAANPEIQNALKGSWPLISLKIIESATKRRDKRIKDILYKYSLKDNEGRQLRDRSNQLVFENPNVLALLLLPHLFMKINKLTSKSKAGNNWSPDQSLVSKAFVHHLEISATSDKGILKAVSTDLQTEHQKFQVAFNHPHIILVGSSLSHITKIYIVMNSETVDCRWEFSSALDAVDAVFKICSVLGRKFPLLVNHIYYFLHIVAYKMPGATTMSAVTKLRQELFPPSPTPVPKNNSKS